MSARWRMTFSYGLSESGGRSRSRVRSISAILLSVLLPGAFRLDRFAHVGDGGGGDLGEIGALDRGALGVVAELLERRAGIALRQWHDRRDDLADRGAFVGILAGA